MIHYNVVISHLSGCDCSDVQDALELCITTHITVIEDLVLARIRPRIMDHQVRLEALLRNPSAEGGCVCSEHIHLLEAACGQRASIFSMTVAAVLYEKVDAGLVQ